MFIYEQSYKGEGKIVFEVEKLKRCKQAGRQGVYYRWDPVYLSFYRQL